jgi:hypothetical protein
MPKWLVVLLAILVGLAVFVGVYLEKVREWLRGRTAVDSGSR